MSHHKNSLALLLLLLCALPIAAQLQVDGVHLGLAGDVSAGYNGDLNPSGSDHGISIGGDATLHGYYFNPNFISFDASPYYGRSQANSSTVSVDDSGGFTSNVSVFGGSHFPGSLGYNQAYNTTGLFGIPGTTGLTTTSDNRSLSLGWAVLLPGLPSLSVGYSDGSGTSSVLGSNGQSEASTRTFTLRSGYRWAGFTMAGGYVHLTTTGSALEILGNSGVGTSSSTNSYSFSVGHAIPLSGAVHASVSRSNYSTNSDVGTETGTNDDANLDVGVKVWRLPLTGAASYTDNLYGSLEEQMLSNGGTFFQTTVSPTSRSLNLSAGTSYMLFNQIFVTGFINRQEQYLAGQSFGLTQYGANAAYNLGRRFKGLVIQVGVVDSASQVGNQGANLLASVNYNRNFGHWEFSGNFGYNQQVQTLSALYTVSSTNYTAQVHRKFKDGLSLNLGAGGGHSGFEQVAGNGAHSEGFNAGVSWHRVSVGGNYSQSSGTSVLTPNGLVLEPVPGIAPANSVVTFGGSGEGFSVSTSPLRGLSVTASYNRSSSNTAGLIANSLNQTELYNAFCTYRFRKIFFNSGVTKFRQSVSSSGIPPTVLTSYYFGISRWFKFF